MALDMHIDSKQQSDSGQPPSDRCPRDIARIADLEAGLRALVARVRSTAGYATPEEQSALWRAEQLLNEPAASTERSTR